MKKIQDFINYFLKKLKVSDAEFSSSYLAYHLLLSFIPLLVFLSQALIYIAPGFENMLYELIYSLPNDVKNIFMPITENIFNSQSSSLSLVAIASSIWLGSRGFLGLIKSLNKIFDIDLTGKIPFYEKIFSVVYTIAFMLLIASFLLLTVFNDKIVSIILSFTDNYPILSKISNFFISWLTRLMPLILSVTVFIFFYRYAPSFKKGQRIKFIPTIIGSTIATLGIVIITFFYKFTNDTLSRSPSIYGTLGSLLVTLVWLLGVCQIIIYGAVFIKSYIEVVIKNKDVSELKKNC